jgi:hypothetical protein
MRNDISTEELLRLRLFNQRVSVQKEKTPSSLLKYFGAMQAQDYPMAKWAVGARLPAGEEKSVQSAVSSGKIIRTHVLRPTWHFVPSEDLLWMLGLTASRLHASSKARLRQLSLTPAIIKKSNRLLVHLLKGRNVTREEIIDAYAGEKIRTSEYRGGHLLFEAELEGLICSGHSDDGTHTYALVSDRIRKHTTLSKEGALKKLAKLYFQSHGPASIADFTWWSGLSPAHAREAVDLNGKTLIRVNHDGQALFVFDLSQKTPELKDSVYLLPAYDEYTIAYKDRGATIDKRFLKNTISTNGIFYPLLLIEGKIAGLWKKQVVKDTIVFTIRQFSPIDAVHRALLSARLKDLEHFYAQKTTVHFTKL